MNFVPNSLQLASFAEEQLFGLLLASTLVCLIGLSASKLAAQQCARLRSDIWRAVAPRGSVGSRLARPGSGSLAEHH